MINSQGLTLRVSLLTLSVGGRQSSSHLPAEALARSHALSVQFPYSQESLLVPHAPVAQ